MNSSILSTSGRNKTEQVVLECFYKMMEVILLAHGLASRSYHPRRRIRFNLDIQELSELRNAMKDYSSLTPLRVVIFSDKVGAAYVCVVNFYKAL